MKRGNQRPTYERVEPYAYSLSEDVAEMFAEDGGATFYPSQLYELELMLARNEDGSPAASTIGISKPRQNGKSYAARFYAVYMAVFEHRDVLYSAHHSTTTKKMFMALCDLFESPERFPDFANDVKSVSHARGYEGFYFKDWKDEDGNIHKGGCIEFATRTNSGARGGTFSVIVIDEAQELTADQQESMLPTVSASSDAQDVELMPQQIYIGTPPSPTCNGTVFRQMHDKAHDRGEASGWWLEWAIETDDILKAIPNKETAMQFAYDTNPAMGYRIAEKTIEDEYANMRLDGFARERLGWWTPVVKHELDYAIDRDTWEACKSTEPKPEGKTAYGVKFSADGSTVALCGAVIPDNGAARISLIELRPTGYGIGWLADWLNQRYKKASCVVIDGRNGVDVLVERIADTWRVKGSIIRPSTRDMIAATGTLTNALSEKSVTWFHQQEVLNDSAITSVKRSLGGGWCFGGDNSAPIEAASLALWGAQNSKRNPNKVMRIG